MKGDFFSALDTSASTIRIQFERFRVLWDDYDTVVGDFSYGGQRLNDQLEKKCKITRMYLNIFFAFLHNLVILNLQKMIFFSIYCKLKCFSTPCTIISGTNKIV